MRPEGRVGVISSHRATRTPKAHSWDRGISVRMCVRHITHPVSVYAWVKHKRIVKELFVWERNSV